MKDSMPSEKTLEAVTPSGLDQPSMRPLAKTIRRKLVAHGMIVHPPHLAPQRLDPQRTSPLRVLLIAVTGWTSSEERRRTLEAGFDYYLIKPVEPARLVRIIQQAPSGMALT